MENVISNDGTVIAFDRVGRGRPLVMVVGAFNDRTAGSELAEVLASYFTVFLYDRRGRGASGDTQPYAVDREIDDLESLIAYAGGSAFVLGFSSGAVLALQAAARGLAITKLVLFDPPLIAQDGRPRPPADLTARLTELISAGRRGDAVEVFQSEAVGLPPELVLQLRDAPFRPALEAMAPTLVYEMTILGDMSLPRSLFASVTMPTLVVSSTESFPWFGDTARAIAEGLPDAQHRSADGLSHDLTPALAPLLEEFLS